VIAGADVAAIDAVVKAELEQTRQPGLTLGLTDREGTLMVRTYGFAELESRRPVTADTLFEIGSIGKSFTAVAILQLVDEGRIDLNAPVDRYLPWFTLPQPVTIAHLLSHTAGIAAGVDATPEAAFQVWSLGDLPMRSAPGERFHYSNVGYKALGLVLEALEGRPYREVLRDRVLEPLGMFATEPAIAHDIRARLAVGYEYLRDDRVGHPGAPLAPATWLQTDTADGSIASTAEDMCAFVRLLLRAGEGLLSERSFADMSSLRARMGETAWYGYGLVTRDVDGRRFIGHGGGMVGYLAGLQADLDAGLGAIVLQNGMGAKPVTLARTAIGIVRGAAATAPVAAADLDLIGVYEADDVEPIEIDVAGDALVLRRGASGVAFEQVGDDLFLAPDVAFDRFPFHVERPNGVPELWHGGRRYARAGAEVQPLSEPSADLRAIAGHYRSHNPWATNFRVVLRGDQPWLLFTAAPDGFDDQQVLVPETDGSFRVGEDPGNPESLSFDTVVEGRTLRAWLSGWPYYRVA
jgi:CubicO group peptidase (beta-lactamase class C family)